MTYDEARAVCLRENKDAEARSGAGHWVPREVSPGVWQAVRLPGPRPSASRNLHAWQPRPRPGVPPTFGRSADAEDRGSIRLALIAAGAMVAAGAAIVVAVLFTWGWELSAAVGHTSAVATRRVAVCTSAVTLLAGLLVARSGRSLRHEFLAHQRRARTSDVGGLDRQAVRNRRFIVGSAALLVISGLLGVLLALTH